MMTRNFAEDANAIVVQAYEHAVRLGHPYLAGEHFLLALAAASRPAGVVLREHGITPERAEAAIVRLSGGGLFSDLDRDALAAVGVDIDTVRAATEASFGQEALSRTARAVHRKPGRLDPRRRRSFVGRHGKSLPLGPGAGQALASATRRARARDVPGPPAPRTSHSASSPSARDWSPRSCRHSACPGRH
ncbi:MAG TPA: Clp protease N-terminal domain-containing protein [Trebonia sp.]